MTGEANVKSKAPPRHLLPAARHYMSDGPSRQDMTAPSVYPDYFEQIGATNFDMTSLVLSQRSRIMPSYSTLATDLLQLRQRS